MPNEGNVADPGKTFTQSDFLRVGVRLPPFWPNDPALWFAQVESSFSMSGIKDDEAKFMNVTSQLDNEYAAEVRDIIVNPPIAGKFEKLKTELIKRLSASRQKQIKQLLMHEELGNRRPSQFLRHLQSLAGPNYPDEFLKTTWTNGLPVNLQTVIASQPHAKLESLAELADTVHELVPSASSHVASADAAHKPTLDMLVQEVSRLSRQVEALTANNRRSRSNTRNNNNRDRRRSRSQSNYRKFPICWYHNKFGNKANHCTKPCDFKSENYPGSR